MLSAIPNPEQFSSTDYNVPGSSASVQFPSLANVIHDVVYLNVQSTCLRLRVTGVSKDLAASQLKSVYNSGYIVGVNLSPGSRILTLLISSRNF